ncbi:MAG: NINE protein [Saprospiraceae bacterium]|nr:NINE protein [Bacteroidia bacterium]MBT8230078.1 NINE protein [Bacteroidia bacterium]NNF21417.1 NINE protein [Saprospiraceae bacterium]
MERSRVAAAFIALIGGSIGLHKFYLKDPGGGIFYIILMFMTARFFPLTALLGIIDAIKLFSMSDEQFDRKYNRRRQKNRRRKSYPSQSRDRRDLKMDREYYQYKQTVAKKRDNPFKKSGEKKYKEYDLEGAIDDFKNALEISPDNIDIHFNMAAVYSLMEKKDLSFFHLEEAVKLGFKDKDKIMTLDDLAYLRIQEEFEEFKNNGYSREAKEQKALPAENLLQDDVLLSQLNKLKDLRSRGLLSQKEFNYEKEKLFRK